MAGARLIVTADDAIKKFVAMRDAVNRKRLGAIGLHLTETTRLRFDESKAPDGTRWKRLSRSTLLNRAGGKRKAFKKRGGLKKRARTIMRSAKPLVDTARLRNSITYAVGRDYVKVGTNVKYAAIHQFGGKAGRKRSVYIPARPYLGLSKSDAEYVERSLFRWIVRA